MKDNNRRDFIRNMALGATALNFSNPVAEGRLRGTASAQGVEEGAGKVWVASITQRDISGDSCNAVIRSAIKQMEYAVGYAPDIYCLPEVFHAEGVISGRPSLDISAENGTGNIIGPLQDFACRYNCYVICPVYTVDHGKYYNAAIVIDRKGKKSGEYRKIRLTEGEIQNGLTPGPVDPPVFSLDFGKIGIQICYDVEWTDGWTQLRKKGAEIVFFPSAFAAGKKLNARAWENQLYVVSSTLKDTTRIIDITGEDIVVSGNWSPWGVCAGINLQKAFVSSYPAFYKFPEITRKYGRRVRCYSLHEEEISVIESLDPALCVSGILEEFGLVTYRQELQNAEEKQIAMRLRK